jgi:type VI secretion system protein ImpI
LHHPPPSVAYEAPMPEPVLAYDVPMPPPVLAPEAPPPPSVPEPAVAAEAAARTQGPTAEEFLARFAKGAGIPDNIFARQDGLKVAEDMGALMRLIAENLTQLLAARFKAKRFARTSNQTMIQALDNNPLKFAPTPEDALRIMFGPRTSGYLDARRALDAAFTDLKAHQLKTFSAMQGAVNMLVEDLDPAEIDTALGPEKSMLDRLGARKARLWDLYLARWQAKTLRHEDGLTDAFMLYFAECYDQSDEKA